MVAARPLRILLGPHLVPKRHGVGTAGPLGGVGLRMVPGPVLQGHGEDVGDRMVQGLARGGRIVFLRIIRSGADQDRKSTRLNSSHVATSYAVFCLKKKNIRRATDVK